MTHHREFPRHARHGRTVLAMLLAAACTSPAASPSGGPPAGSPQVADVPALADVPYARVDLLGHLAEPGPLPSGKPSLAWRHHLGLSNFTPVLGGGLIIAGSSEQGFITAIDAHTGVERWRFDLAKTSAPEDLGGSAAINGDTVFVGDASTIYALDLRTGSKRWAASVAGRNVRPRIADGVVYVGSSDGAVGLDARTGAQVWSWAGPAGGSSAWGPIADGVGYFPAADGKLYAIDLHDGHEKWSVQTISRLVGSSEVVGDSVYVGTNTGDSDQPVGALYAIDRETGAVRWTFQGPSGGQINAGPVRDGVIYFGTAGDGLYALRDAGPTYDQVWHVDTPRTLFPVSMAGDALIEQRFDGSIGDYGLTDGHLRWETAPTGDNGGGPPIVSGGMVFAGHDTSGVAAYADPALIARLDIPPPVPDQPAPTPPALANPFDVAGSASFADLSLKLPLGMDPGPDGNLYVLDVKPQVEVIDPNDGSVLRRWGEQGSGPGAFDLRRRDDNPGNGDIAVAPDGRVYVADGSNHRIQVFAPDGTYLSQFGSSGSDDGQFGEPQEIVVAPDGSVYVLDFRDRPISKFTADGKFLWRSPDPTGDPDLGANLHGIAVRGDGSLLVACEGCHRLLVLDPTDGHVRDRIQLDGFDAGLSNLGPDGNIYTSEFVPQAELVLGPAGQLLAGTYARRITVIGKTISWGDVFWPAPVFLRNGRAFSFWHDSIVELRIKLPGS